MFSLLLSLTQTRPELAQRTTWPASQSITSGDDVIARQIERGCQVPVKCRHLVNAYNSPVQNVATAVYNSRNNQQNTKHPIFAQRFGIAQVFCVFSYFYAFEATWGKSNINRTNCKLSRIKRKLYCCVYVGLFVTI